MIRITLAAALLATAAPLMAQSTVQPEPNLPPTTPLPYDRGYDKDTPRTDAVNAVEAPVTADLNNRVDAVTTVRSAAEQAAYDADIAAYRAQVAANARETLRDDARYQRQQRAYADAMSAWRVQAAACEKGRRAACNAPSPNPADFY